MRRLYRSPEAVPVVAPICSSMLFEAVAVRPEMCAALIASNLRVRAADRLTRFETSRSGRDHSGRARADLNRARAGQGRNRHFIRRSARSDLALELLSTTTRNL